MNPYVLKVLFINADLCKVGDIYMDKILFI